MQPSRWRAIRMAASAWRTVASTVIVAAFACCHAASAAPTHPLDPLDAGELVAVRDILAQSGRFSTTTNFAWIGLAEPPKKIVEEFRGGVDFPRQAYVAAIDYDKGRSFRVIIDLRSGRIASMDDLGALHPGLTDADLDIAAAIVDADPRIKAALIRRGLDIPDRVTESVRVQYQPVGADRTLDQEKNRLLRVLFTSDQNANSNTSPYIDGLMAVVDLYAKTVIRFDDSPGAASVPVPHDVLDPKLRDAVAAARAVVPTQPDGRNFAVEGNVVTWRNWRLRFGFNLREGLVLYQVGFNDRGRLRPILYRASVSEVLTAYGDPGRSWSWMLIFDEGAWGLGYLSAPVQPGREVPANAMTLGAVVPDPTREQFSDLFADRIYLYERDAGNLMYYQEDGQIVHARATELVIGSLVSLGNYMYAFNWVFREDGFFAFEAELSGTILSKFVVAKDCETCAAVAQGPGSDGESRSYEFERRRQVRRPRSSQRGRREPSALVQPAPGFRHRRRTQRRDGKQREAGRRGGRQRRIGGFRGHRGRSHRAGQGRGGQAPNQPRELADLDYLQSVRLGPRPAPDRLHTDADGKHGDHLPARARARAGGVHVPSPLGHALPRRRALCRRRLSEPGEQQLHRYALFLRRQFIDLR